MNPNQYLAVAIDYLLTHRPRWPAQAAVGKTIVSSGMIDRIVAKRGYRLCEVPVGFKWFVPGLFDGLLSFGGEDSPAPAFPPPAATLCSPAAVEGSELAGESITAKLSAAPGNGAAIGGVKVVARSGWFAARPSGTESIYKIYAESFKDQAHLDAIVREAEAMVNRALQEV